MLTSEFAQALEQGVVVIGWLCWRMFAHQIAANERALAARPRRVVIAHSSGWPSLPTSASNVTGGGPASTPIWSTAPRSARTSVSSFAISCRLTSLDTALHR